MLHQCAALGCYYHKIYAIPCNIVYHWMECAPHEPNQFRVYACICPAASFPHSTKTFKLNRFFDYLSHHRICTWFMFNVFFFSFLSLSLHFPCSFFCYLFSTCLVWEFEEELQFAQSFRWIADGVLQNTTRQLLPGPMKTKGTEGSERVRYLPIPI